MSRVKLSDGSSWPRPFFETDEDTSPAWKARYTPTSLTRSDLMLMASMCDAYGYLICNTTEKRRNQVIREIRKWLSQ